jgi:hypothetical protein
LGEAVFAAFHGVADQVENPMLQYVAEFNARSRLARLGYRFDARGLSSRKAYIFNRISSEYDRLASGPERAVDKKTRV